MTRTTRAMIPLFFLRRAVGPVARGEALKIIMIMLMILLIMIIMIIIILVIRVAKIIIVILIIRRLILIPPTSGQGGLDHAPSEHSRLSKH